MIEQRTNEWYIQRLGMFTASKFGKLLNTKRGGVGFGDTAMAYIYEVAAERQLKKQLISLRVLRQEDEERKRICCVCIMKS